MLTSGDVVDPDLGVPTGSEAGLKHPAVVITAREVLDQRPSVVQVVPLTYKIRRFHIEIEIAPEHSGLDCLSAAQCQHIRSVSTSRVQVTRGNVGPAGLKRIREVLALLLDLE